MKLFSKLLLVLILPIFLYMAIATLFMLFPANKSQVMQHSNDSAVLLTHDLAHVNILIDLPKSSIDWKTLMPEVIPSKQGYLLVGWGDKQTYQSTPNWSDLTASVALQALFLKTPSALHARYLPTINNLRSSIIQLEINEQTSKSIEQNVLKAFPNSIPQVVSVGYGDTDRFYQSSGSYHLFNTCNTWAGDVLRQSGVPVSRWTPFSYNVVHSIPADFKKAL